MARKHRFRDVLVIPDDPVLDPPDGLRRMLLNRFPPTFNNVYCKSITLAYSVGRYHDQPPRAFVPVLIYGYYVDQGQEALLCRVQMGKENEYYQPLRQGEDRRRLYHITLSLADGVKPGDVGLIDPSLARTITEPIPVALEAKRTELWVEKPEQLQQVRRA